MAWPYDARYQDFIANQQVPSAFLNDVQDKIKSLYAAQTVIVTSALADPAYWMQDSAGFLRCSGALNAVSLTMFHQSPFEDFQINEVDVKYFNNAGGAAAVDIDIESWDCDFDSPTSAPTQSVIGTIEIRNAAGTWAVYSKTGLSNSITEERALVFKLKGNGIATPTVGDKLIMRVKYLPKFV